MRGILLWSLAIPIPAIIRFYPFREIQLIPESRREALITPSSRMDVIHAAFHACGAGELRKARCVDSKSSGVLSASAWTHGALETGLTT